MEENGKFIPENGNGACNKVKAGKRMQCILRLKGMNGFRRLGVLKDLFDFNFSFY